LPDLGFYPKILGILEIDGIFLGIYFFKNLGIYLGNRRHSSGELLININLCKTINVFLSTLSYFLITEHKISV